jgi:hypothetical protein
MQTEDKVNLEIMVDWVRGYGVTTPSHLGRLRYGPFVHHL